MINQGYENAATLARRIAEIEAWLANPSLLVADENAEYAAVIEIDLRKLPNLSSVRLTIRMTPGCCRKSRTPIDEVFIGSCMTNIGHFRAAGKIIADAREIPTAVAGSADENGCASACQ
jgi:aconitate hydratase 2/2-methylisocitrate dehydratase